VSRPVEELRTLYESPQADLDDLLESISDDLRGHFEVKIHQDLRADMCTLGSERLGAAHRIVSEALWNAVKHSGAKNVRITSREVGSVVLVKVSDDGRGISKEDASAGVGISLMRDRAEAVGAGLDLISPTTGGATVQVRFEKE
jgi:signal transduction histidine kinase